MKDERMREVSPNHPYGLGRMRGRKDAGAVNRKPTANMRQSAATDSQIDTLVYELYGLTEEQKP
jgi:hypothetical protein